MGISVAHPRVAIRPLFPGRIGIWNRDENQQQTQPTYDTETGNRTRAILMGGECSHHCAILAPNIKDKKGAKCSFTISSTGFVTTLYLALNYINSLHFFLGGST